MNNQAYSFIENLLQDLLNADETQYFHNDIITALSYIHEEDPALNRKPFDDEPNLLRIWPDDSP